MYVELHVQANKKHRYPCVYIYIYVYIKHTHTYIYIYLYVHKYYTYNIHTHTYIYMHITHLPQLDSSKAHCRSGVLAAAAGDGSERN